MKEIRYRNGSSDGGNWPRILVVAVQGDSGARRWNAAGASESWPSVVVLEVTPHSANFMVGFRNGSNMYMQLLQVPVLTVGGKFGIRIGKEDVELFVIPTVLATRPRTLEVVEITTETNPFYADLPLY